MSDNSVETDDSFARDSFERMEQRSRALFEASVERVDMRVRSRLNRARQAALEARPALFTIRPRIWAPAFGAVASVILGLAIWSGRTTGVDPLPAVSDTHSGYEDLDVVASNDQLDLLQDDIEFYDWADAQSNTGSTGSG